MWTIKKKTKNKSPPHMRI